MSDVTAHAIDEEIRSTIDNAYQKAEQILTDNLEKLHLMAEALIKYETIDEQQIRDIMQGKEPRPPKDWEDTGRPTAATGSPKESEEEEDAERPIGGPASQH